MPETARNRLLHDLPAVTVRTCSVSEMDNNVYLLTSKTTGAQVLIDAAAEAEAIRDLIASAADDTPCEPRLEMIVTTHRHWDHVRALPALASLTGARTAAGEDDADAIEDVELRVDGATLKLRRKGRGWGERPRATASGPITVTLSSPTLAAALVSGGARVTAARLRGARMDLSASGSSEIGWPLRPRASGHQIGRAHV